MKPPLTGSRAPARPAPTSTGASPARPQDGTARRSTAARSQPHNRALCRASNSARPRSCLLAFPSVEGRACHAIGSCGCYSLVTPPLPPARETSFLPLSAGYSHQMAPVGNSEL